MLQLPFDIPQSLVSYAEQFEREPQRATDRLKKQLKKRGPDAIGYFLLAWFHHLRDQNEKAVKEALKAQTFAPGSPFFKKFHYYLSHPDLFEAWTPEARHTASASMSSSFKQQGPVLDLDDLIQKLSSTEAQRIRPDKDFSKDAGGSSADIDTDVDGIFSETLAKIHEEQGKFDTAIHSYQQLKKLKPEKRDYFNQQIARLTKLKKNSGEQ